MSANVWAQLPEGAFDNVNSPYNEDHPVISPDGKSLFFTRSNSPENIGGASDKGDIWYATLNELNRWSLPQNLGKPFNNSGWNGVLGFSADGNTMYLYGHYNPDGSQSSTQGVSASYRRGAKWSKPEKVNIPYFKNKSSNHGGFVASNEKVMFFSLETFGTRGAEDIYVALKKGNGEWGEPKNLGDQINSRLQEFNPVLSSDMKTLYFASNGSRGEGSFDIFWSIRLDDTWKNWSKPINLGTEINTSGREKSFIYNTSTHQAIYISNTDSDGYGDIKLKNLNPPHDSVSNEEPVVVEETEEQPDSTVVAAIVETSTEEEVVQPDTVATAVTEVVEKPVLKVYGIIIDDKTGQGVEAKVTVSNPQAPEQTVTTGVNEQGYTVEVEPGDNYTIKIEAHGYISVQKDIASANGADEVEMDFRLQPIEKGVTVKLEHVLFKRGTTELLESSYTDLDLVAAMMLENATMEIELAGHTDNRGIAKYNIKLSEERVKSVKKYLVGKGISSKRISGKGYGGMKPIASNRNEETRKLNRRVEFTIVKE
ncbi:MAG: OmpA family protein [Bacteroidota bacterium]